MTTRVIYISDEAALISAVVGVAPTVSVNPPPVVDGISLDSLSLGSGQQTLTVSGSSFIASSVVKIDGVSAATTFVSSAQLSFVVPSTVVAVAGTKAITVFTPLPGGGTSNTANLVVERQIIWSADFTALSAGSVTAAALLALGSGGLIVTRASTATAQTSASATVSAAIDTARAANTGAGVRGLLIEEARTQYARNSGSLGTWSKSPSASYFTVTDDALAAPDGTTTAERVQSLITIGLLFASGLTAPVNTPYVGSIWVQHRAGADAPFTLKNSANAFGGGVTDGTVKTWKRYFFPGNSDGSGNANVCLSSVSPNLPDAYAWGSQVEIGGYPTSYISQTFNNTASRAGERLYAPITPVVDVGRLGIVLSFYPLGASNEQTGNVRVFTTSAGDYAEVSRSSRVLTVSIGGVIASFAALPAWARGDKIELWIAAGGALRASVASVRINGGATVDLGVATAQPYASGTTIDFLCNGATQVFSAEFASVATYAAGVKVLWANSAGALVAASFATISTLSVTAVSRWSDAVDVTLTGTGFSAPCIVQVDGVTPAPVQNLDGSTTASYAFVNPSTMTLKLPASTFFELGSRAIKVLDQLGNPSISRTVSIAYESAIKLHSRNDPGDIVTGASGLSSLVDQTSNAANLVAPTAAKQPAIISAGLNGRSTFRYDGVDDRTATPSAFVVAQPCGLIHVMKQVAWATGAYISDGASAATTGSMGQGSTTPEIKGLGSGGSFVAPNTQATIGAWKTVHMNLASSLCKIDVNNGVQSSATTTSGGLNGLSVGGAAIDVAFANVEHAEHLIYGSGISAATLPNYRRYLEARHGGAIAKRRNVVMIGDSITQGGGVSNYVTQLSLLPAFANGAWTFTNLGVNGRSVATITAAYSAEVVPLLDLNAVNIACVLMGTNGGQTSSQYTGIASYCSTLKAAGWTVIVGTYMSYAGSAAVSDLYRGPDNVSIRANYATIATGLADFSDSVMGLTNSYLDLLYFQPDQTHPALAGSTHMAGVMAPILAKVGY